jgi:hypothetical protein
VLRITEQTCNSIGAVRPFADTDCDRRSAKALLRTFRRTHHLVLSLDRNPLLTIRNLTGANSDRMFGMNVITVRRTVFHGIPDKRSVKRTLINGRTKKTTTARGSLRELVRRYFAREHSWEFAIEALFFVIIVATSAWPILAAAGALHEFLERALT